MSAVGDAERIEVQRSVLVTDGSELYAPVRQHIDKHGLVAVAQETFPDPRWMFGSVEMSIYRKGRAQHEL